MISYVKYVTYALLIKQISKESKNNYLLQRYMENEILIHYCWEY